ncbi:MAG: GGDEF domain-containing protein [Alphaproteobacteria bacterium]|nr:GGDEF domain-containing protein [Alphaproteobacteria bacterium]
MITWNNPQSVRAPLIAVIGLILIAGFAATNLISYTMSKKSVRETLINNELPLTSNNIYSEIQHDLLRPVFVSSLMANDTFVKDWLTHGEVDEARMIRYLDEIRKKYGVFTSFLVSETTRKYYHFSGISQIVSEDDPRDTWYFRVRDMAGEHELNVDFNAEQGNALTIFINHKIMDDDGRFLAATGVGLDFKTVAKIVDRYKDHFGRHVYFIDEAGRVMVRSDGATVREADITTAPGISTIAKAVLSADQGFFEYERGGETLLVSTRAIPDLKWRVLVEQRESDALASIRKSILTNFAVGVAVIGLTLLVVAYAVNRFHSRLELMATTDKLTGIGNRSVFDLSLGQAVKLFKRDGYGFSVILFDIDHFKRINDTLGHIEGDRVIRDLAETVQGLIRESDLLCRWGGEEFIILAHDCDLAPAAAKAEGIRRAIETAQLVGASALAPLTVSLGVTEIRPGDTADTVLKRADGALYEAKSNGRNQTRQA